jgi:hypothetical protein
MPVPALTHCGTAGPAAQPAAIGALTDAADILAGRAGTTINATPPPTPKPAR